MSKNHKSGSLVPSMIMLGERYFPGREWRNSLSYFITGIALASLSDFNPEMQFGQITLGMSLGTREFYARWSGGPATYRQAPIDPEYVKWVGNSGPEVAKALQQFMQNDAIQMLAINLGRNTAGELHYVTFRKGARRGDLHIYGENLPTVDDLCGRTRE